MTPETERQSIFRATRADVPVIADISNRAAEVGSANFATEPEPESLWLTAWERAQATYPWLVAKREDEILGFAKASFFHPRGAYAWSAEVTVYVRPELAGRRIGTRLYERLIPLMRAQGFVTLVAAITSPNPPSERLHAAFGFRQCATFHRIGWKLGSWHDVAYWELQLQGEASAPAPVKPVDDVWRDEP
jgi:phosphinothricin acetyltransferase